MQYLAILICAIICLFSWRKEKNFYNPITVMAGLWMVITIPIFCCAIFIFLTRNKIAAIEKAFLERN